MEKRHKKNLLFIDTCGQMICLYHITITNLVYNFIINWNIGQMALFCIFCVFKINSNIFSVIHLLQSSFVQNIVILCIVLNRELSESLRPTPQILRWNLKHIKNIFKGLACEFEWSLPSLLHSFSTVGPAASRIALDTPGLWERQKTFIDTNLHPFLCPYNYKLYLSKS